LDGGIQAYHAALLVKELFQLEPLNAEMSAEESARERERAGKERAPELGWPFPGRKT